MFNSNMKYHSTIAHPDNKIGNNVKSIGDVCIGYPTRSKYNSEDSYPGATIGDNAILRSGTIIYCDVFLGRGVQTGHNVIIREFTTIGEGTSIGSNTIIEGYCVVGKHTNIQSNVFIPTNCDIGDNVFIGPCCVFTNDKYPPSYGKLIGVVIEDGAKIGANVTVTPGVIIGKGAFIAAGALVTRDVPANMMAIGSPAKIMELPEGFKP
jgi:acetyltransferase-like isoleucine patch superfamily enzyme